MGEKYGCLLNAWNKGVDSKGIGFLDEAAFCAAIDHEGLDSKRLWQALRSRVGQLKLKAEDLKLLLIGAPLDQREKMWGNADHSERPAWTPLPKSMLPNARPHAEAVLHEFHSQDHIMDTLEEFRK